MTNAICMRCGSKKFGCLVLCHNCGFKPNSSVEINVSMTICEKSYSSEELDALSESIKKRNLISVDPKSVDWNKIYGFR